MTKDDVLQAQKVRIKNLKNQNEILKNELRDLKLILNNKDKEINTLNRIIKMQDQAIEIFNGRDN